MKKSNSIIPSTKLLRLKTKYKWIHFIDVSEYYPKRKTYVYYCYNNSDTCLGMIEWNKSWRQYWFVTEEQIGLAVSCLTDISDFISQLMELRIRK